MGASAEDVLAFGTALTAVGVKAEAGGTAISRVFKEIQVAVGLGGKELARFAEVAGVSTEAFAGAFKKDAAEATTLFIEGLQKLSKEGVVLRPILEELNFSSQRIQDSLIRSAGAGDLLRRALERSRKASKENTALQVEYNERLKDFNTQIKLLDGAINALRISVGQKLLPVFTELIQKAIIPFVEELGNAGNA